MFVSVVSWVGRIAYAVPARRLVAHNFFEGIPDAQGLLNGTPNPNRLASGDDILLSGGCNQPDCSDAIAALTDSEGQAVQSTLDRISPGTYYLRVHPTQPLASGMYTLTATLTFSGMLPTPAPTFVFKVEGPASAPPLPFEIAWASASDTLSDGAGSEFNCILVPSPGDPHVHTQRRPRFDVLAKPTTAPTYEQNEAYLYRLLATDDLTADQTTPWTTVPATEQGVRVSSSEVKPEYCVVLQSLRLRDFEISSLGKRCLTRDPEATAPLDPEPFSACMMIETDAYVRAWCSDNREACLANNPRAALKDVLTACEPYAQICAPFLGNRTSDDRFCED